MPSINYRGSCDSRRRWLVSATSRRGRSTSTCASAARRRLCLLSHRPVSSCTSPASWSWTENRRTTSCNSSRFTRETERKCREIKMRRDEKQYRHLNKNKQKLTSKSHGYGVPQTRRLGAVSYSHSIVTMAVSVAVCEIFSVKKWCDLENRVGVRSSSLEMAPFDRSHTSSYLLSIVTIALSCIVCEI